MDDRAWALACLNLARNGAKVGLEAALLAELDAPSLDTPEWAAFVMRLRKGEVLDEDTGACGLCMNTGFKTRTDDLGRVYGRHCDCSRGQSLHAAVEAKKHRREARRSGIDDIRRRMNQAGDGDEDEAVESIRDRMKGEPWWTK